MKVGILSDTHGLLRDEVRKALSGADHIIHAGDIDSIIRKAMKMTDKGKGVEDIARSCSISPSLADDICRMYLTHPGIDAGGIIQRIEGR